MEKVIQTGSRDVMDSTIAELSGTEAFDLLQECTQRLLGQPIRGQVLGSWIQRILVHHCAFIGSQPALRGALEPLHDALQARISSHRALLRLRGRLQLALQMGKQCLEAGDREKATVRMPLLEYVEGDETAPASESDGSEDEDEEGEDEGSDFDDIFSDGDDDFLDGM